MTAKKMQTLPEPYKPIFQIIGMLKTDDPKHDEEVGRFITEENIGYGGDWDVVVKEANKHFGSNGWDRLQAWEISMVMRDMIEKK